MPEIEKTMPCYIFKKSITVGWGNVLMEYTHFVSVAALVTNENGEVLFIRSPNRGWEYPGAK